MLTASPLLQQAADEEPSSVTGRKDSLSINLEFVKVSLSRMRRSGGPTFTEVFIPAKGGKIDTTLINISGTPGRVALCSRVSETEPAVPVVDRRCSCQQISSSALSCVRHRLGFLQVRHEATERDPGLPPGLVPPEHRQAPLPGRPDHQPTRCCAEKAACIWINGSKESLQTQPGSSKTSEAVARQEFGLRAKREQTW